MPILPLPSTESLSIDPSKLTVTDLLERMKSAGVKDLIFETDDGEAIYFTADAAIAQVLKGVYEESEDPSSFFKDDEDIRLDS